MLVTRVQDRAGAAACPQVHELTALTMHGTASSTGNGFLEVPPRLAFPAESQEGG